MWRALLMIGWRSAWDRRFALFWVIFSIALASFLLLSVEKLRHSVQDHFARAVTGTDLIVGPRSGSLPLLLYSVFHIGHANNTMRWSSFETLQHNPAVKWAIPISLGDTHKRFPVVATNQDYFVHLRYGQQQALQLRSGQTFQAKFEAVLGAEVAEQLGYQLGARLVLRHGAGELDHHDHEDHPFTVVGILERTGTPTDRAILIPLMGMEALHQDWIGGMPLPRKKVASHAHAHDHTHDDHDHAGHEQASQPKQISAVLLGLQHRSQVLSLQRQINTLKAEPLTALLPGVALDELWSIVSNLEKVLLLMSSLVALVSLAGLIAVVMTALAQRRREMAILRSVGASPRYIFSLLAIEGVLLSCSGIVLGVLLCLACQLLAQPWLASHYGIQLSIGPLTLNEVKLLALILITGCFASLLPGWRAYRLTLSDGLSPKGS